MEAVFTQVMWATVDLERITPHSLYTLLTVLAWNRRSGSQPPAHSSFQSTVEQPCRVLSERTSGTSTLPASCHCQWTRLSALMTTPIMRTVLSPTSVQRTASTPAPMIVPVLTATLKPMPAQTAAPKPTSVPGTALVLTSVPMTMPGSNHSAKDHASSDHCRDPST